MKEFKVGGKITISENEKYRVIDIIKEDSKKYYFCCTEEKPIAPKVFERVEKEEKVYIKLINDKNILTKIVKKL